ncbi:MAG: alpha/beta hydrolase-fold protein [Terriglobia bacterium]
MNPLRTSRRAFFGFLTALPAAQAFARPSEKYSGLHFEISFSPEMSTKALDGRVYLLLSRDGSREPRFQISPEVGTQQMFGVDVNGFAPGATASIDPSAQGYPFASVREIPSGDYFVQGLLNVYETFHLASGYDVKLPPDRGEGQRWNIKPGNLYSTPQRLHLDPAGGGLLRIVLNQKIPPISPISDTKYVKHLRIQSRLLTKFWGTPMEIGAVVILPEGWEEHPDARYPLMIQQGHFSPTWNWPTYFRTQPPTPNLKGDERAMAEYSFKFFQDWTSGRLPHMLLMIIQHANPYFDDSYAVNSANVGPYGDAIVEELIPEVERRFRGLGEPWARALYGGSTGGWETLAMQVFYPDFFNSAWVFCPDPIDFRAFFTANIYDDKNLFWEEGPWLRIARPLLRSVDAQILATIKDNSQYALARGTHRRSGTYFDVYEAVYGPAGPDGYPRPLYDRKTGAFDPEVVAYWREHYDLSHILQRDWKALGPKLVGKLHFTVGTRDTWYLDNAVRLVQKFLESTNDPYYAGSFEYGPHMPHGFWGNAHVPHRIGQFTVHQRIMPAFEEWMAKTAPQGADLTSWKYLL